MSAIGWAPLTIRVRLGAALAAALAPILLLGAAQSAVSVQRQANETRLILTAAAERSASVARSRMQGAEIVLRTVTPEAVGVKCAPQLHVLINRTIGYANLIRFDANGRVSCAAETVGPDPGRSQSEWFSALRSGKPAVVARAPAGAYDAEPALITAVRDNDAQGDFNGALAAVILLSSLKPNLNDRSLPAGTQVALIDQEGHFLVRTDRTAFNTPPPDLLGRVATESLFYQGKDAAGQWRVFATAPLVDGVSVVLSAPHEGLFSWARVNPLSAVLLPLAAFFMALASVWVVADRVAIRWLHYLDRVAAIYAKGRFSVRPVKAASGPPEIRALARSLDVMAQTIAGRDHSLRESLAQKDALMREIHHRVKNNLQVISSLLNMQQRALTDSAARAAISDTRQRIGALALIYRALYQGPDLRRVDLHQFLDELIGQILTSDAESHPPIRTDLEADELAIDPDKLAPLALFAVEAISNARKHAFAAGGVLHVRFRLEGEEATLEIADEGSKIGPPVIGEGVGRTLMTAFARQLRGRVEIVPNEAGGVTVRLNFPAPEARSKRRAA
jgi:two-component sensor histidine kinase